MTHELINPDGLPRPLSYTHVVVASGTRIVFIAGQVAEDPDDNLVGRGDVAAQARQAFANVGRCLSAAGAQPHQVTMLRIYVVGHRPEFLPGISRLGCQSSAITSRPTQSSEWSGWPRMGA